MQKKKKGSGPSFRAPDWIFKRSEHAAMQPCADSLTADTGESQERISQIVVMILHRDPDKQSQSKVGI
jgi:hypothetical protein